MKSRTTSSIWISKDVNVILDMIPDAIAERSREETARIHPQVAEAKPIERCCAIKNSTLLR